MANGHGIPDEEALNIYTDGSCYPKKKWAGGVGVLFVWVDKNGHEKTHPYAPPGWKSATAPAMELMALKIGLEEAKFLFPDLSRFKNIQVYSDNRYVVDGFTLGMHVWSKRGWRGSNDMPVAHIDLWKKVYKLDRTCEINVKVDWVKGHKSSDHNKEADQLAKESAAAPLNKPYKHRTPTRKWSKEMTKQGCVKVRGQTLKIRIVEPMHLNKSTATRYRYEVIDPDDEHFALLDFLYCYEHLSRGHCYEVRLNDRQKTPTVEEVLSKLEIDDYKY